MPNAKDNTNPKIIISGNKKIKSTSIAGTAILSNAKPTVRVAE